MKLFKNFKKRNAMSLMEISIALLIVAILAGVTIPIIGRQLERTDEFAYYMAYRSVEKLASQIVVLGDPEEDESFTLNFDDSKFAEKKPNEFIAYLKNKYSNGVIAKNFGKFSAKISSIENNIFKKLFPKTFATRDLTYTDANVTQDILVWNSSEYDKLWLKLKVCKANATDVPCKQVEVGTSSLLDGLDRDTIDKIIGKIKDNGNGSNGQGQGYGNLAHRLSDPENWTFSTQVVYYSKATGQESPDEENLECKIDCSAYDENSYPLFSREAVSSSSSSDTIPQSIIGRIFAGERSGTDDSDTVSLVPYTQTDKDQLLSRASNLRQKVQTGKVKDNTDFAQIFKSQYCNSTNYPNLMTNTIANGMNLSATAPNASAFCEGTFKTSCEDNSSNPKIIINSNSFVANSSSDSSASISDLTPHSANAGDCHITQVTSFRMFDGLNSIEKIKGEEYTEDWPSKHGYVNMINVAAPDALDIRCKPGYIQTVNNDKVCGKASYITEPEQKLYYSGTAKFYMPSINKYYEVVDDVNRTFLACKYGFHQLHDDQGYCCPENAHFNGSKCACNPRYDHQKYRLIFGGGPNYSSTAYNPPCNSGDCALESCKLVSCAPGFHIIDGDKCLKNPPIIRANRFCEIIAETWNTKESSCSESGADKIFTGGATSNYQELVSAATGNDQMYLSIKSKNNAFRDLTPNIVLANGLKMWILGNKTATIPGLSYYEDVENLATSNMCELVHTAQHTKEACQNAGGYYCGTEFSCVKLNNKTANLLTDPRNCCGVVDKAGLSKTDPMYFAKSGFTIFVDINGNKGEGTLWEDVYPFFITTDGKVYPAYPLNGEKAIDAESNALYLGGNNEKQLSVDVYYYDQADQDKKEKHFAYKNVPYARGACLAKMVSEYTPYCQNLGEKFKMPENDPCATHNCAITVKKRTKFL